MADVTIVVDGITVTVPAGTNVVDAARQAGVSIPVFCYHPRMKPVGMCRMCLVEVWTPRVDPATRQPVLDDKGKPVMALMMNKLQTGCTTPVSDGMEIRTQTEQVKFAQRGVLEFLLTSHPLDCPVCDKGGECPLQNLTMEWGPGNSRFDYTEKVHFQKPLPLGDLIYLDRERCILCGRCVRFQDEIAADPVLGFDNRGRKWAIISKSDPPFDSKFSGNTTDICPVGALTTADFRFRARVWEVSPKPSICTHCPVGCNITLDMRHNQIMRVMPRENGAVNDIWICDKGRFGQRFVESQERLTTPLIRRGNTLEPATWDEALQLVAEKFAAVLRSKGSEALAGLAGERLSNEDLYAFQKLFREVLGSNNIDHRVGAPGEAADDDIGAELGVGRGTNLMELGKGTTVLVFGADPEEEAPLYMLRLRAIAQRGGELIVANVRPTKLDASATQQLRYAPGSEVTVLRALLSAVFELVGTERLTQRVSGIEELRAVLRGTTVEAAAAAAGLNAETLRAVARSFVQAEHGIIVYGADALAAGPALTQDLGSLAVLGGKVGRANSGLIALLPRGNSRGALDMGVRPDRGPGYASLSQRGLGAREIWGAVTEGRVRGLYVMGLDPLRDYPATVTALEKLEFLVVQDMFLTATAQHADVVLPAAAFAERDGTYTNAERRVQRARQSRPILGECRPDWAIVQGVAQRLAEQGDLQQLLSAQAAKAQKQKNKSATQETLVAAPPVYAWDYVTVGDVATEIAARVPGYTGITHAKLASTGTGGNWGRQVNESIYYDGTSYENTEGVGLQYPALIEQQRVSINLAPRTVRTPSTDGQYPFTLLVQRLLYDGDPLLRDSRLLSHVPAPYLAISTGDAQRLGIRAGETVRVASAAGTLDLPARVVVDLPTGSVLIPADLPGASLATLQTGPRTMVAVSKL